MENSRIVNNTLGLGLDVRTLATNDTELASTLKVSNYTCVNGTVDQEEILTGRVEGYDLGEECEATDPIYGQQCTTFAAVATGSMGAAALNVWSFKTVELEDIYVSGTGLT